MTCRYLKEEWEGGLMRTPIGWESRGLEVKRLGRVSLGSLMTMVKSVTMAMKGYDRLKLPPQKLELLLRLRG
jgi:hypothetical protein